MAEMRKWLAELYSRSKACGFQGVETYYCAKESRLIKLYQGDLEHFEIASDAGLSFRGLYQGREGRAYTTTFDHESIRHLLDQAVEYARTVGKSVDASTFHLEGTKTFHSTRGGQYETHDAITLKTLLNDIETKCSAGDPRIVQVSPCSVFEVSETVHLTNDLGKNNKERYRSRQIELGVVASNSPEQGMVNASGHIFLSIMDQMEVAQLVETVKKDALRLLDSTSDVSKDGDLILRGSAFADLLAGFSGVFCADQVQNQLSCLKGLEGKPVANDCFVLMERPKLKVGSRRRRFDDEGMATRDQFLIRKGVLTSYLYDTASAKKVGRISTGNGFRRDFKAPVAVMPTHLVVKKGVVSLERMTKGLVEGVCITALHGLHAGINPVSGDFSLSCEGYTIREGVPHQGLAGVTVTGNLLSLLQGIQVVADDQWVSNTYMPYVQTPSVRVSGLVLSGK